jgi:UDP-N-acetylmuramate--alanine ligase
MIDLKKVQKLFFVGIGGIGMSALARYFSTQGKSVSGYDRTESVLTKQLINEGIHVLYEDDIESIPKNVDLVVYTPAVPGDLKLLLYFRQNDYIILKRSDVLGSITESSFNICVAGTHGKTTITTMIAHILRNSGFGCNAFLGGIAANYNTNFWSNARDVCVVEADEYDRSFLKLSPDIGIITAMDADHLDIYGSAKEVKDAFVEFSGKIKQGGLLISKKGLVREKELGGDRRLSYSLADNNADSYPENVRLIGDSYEFDIVMKDWRLKNVVLKMGGMHNVENITAAITVAHELQIEDEKIKRAVIEFKGVKRRFEYIIRKEKQVFIDDYAHHPEELKAVIGSSKKLFPGMKSVIVFQPHLYTRTRDFADEFARSLEIADEIILLPIYPAREQPIEGVTSEMVYEKIGRTEKHLMGKEELMDWLRENKTELLITAGAGDIDGLVEPIREILLNN